MTHNSVEHAVPADQSVLAVSEEDIFWMTEAIQLAKKGLYTTDPNPRVGCVLVKNGKAIGSGYHIQAGEPHAEVYALREAGENALGAIAYVTLEPCSHFGRTPPCAKALVEAGVVRVVVGMQDPNPSVCGGGIALLRAAGIAVEVGVCESQVRALNPGFIKRFTKGSPWVRLKIGASIDGRTAMASGESKWITSSKSRLDVQKLRAQSSCVLTGIHTVLADDPSLAVRVDQWNDAYPETPCAFNEGERVRQPVRVILDRCLRVDPDASIFNQPGKTIVVVGDQLASSQETLARMRERAELWVVPLDASGRLDLRIVLKKLADIGMNEVLVEAGATLTGAFLSQQLVDECILYLAPKFLGATARPMVDISLAHLQDAFCYQVESLDLIGEDIKVILMPFSSSRRELLD